MPLYKVDPNPHRVTYGKTLGMLVMKSRVPCIPGSVSNASTFRYPVMYRVVEGLDVRRLVYEADESLIEPILREARALEKAGAAAISSDCGYMALFQRQIAAQLRVPVCLSSLLQVPFIRTILPASQKIGIVVADSRSVRPHMLEAVGINASSNAVIAGMEGRKAFWSAIMDEEGELDSDAIEKELLTVVRELIGKHPDIGALLLECSEFPAYSAAVQAAFGKPVFDFMTMLDYVHSSLVRQPYRGTM